MRTLLPGSQHLLQRADLMDMDDGRRSWPGTRAGKALLEWLGRLQPATVIGVLMAAHVLIWTLTPALSLRGLPLDVVEGYAIGRQWVVGYFKHPSLPWWLLEASRIATGGAMGWPAYLLSALSIALTYGCVYLIGRDFLGPARAAAGTLLLGGIVYFSWVTPEFNHNVAQMPIWVAVVLALARARARRHRGWWMLLGALSAVGLYIKFTMAILLVAAALYILVDSACRRQLRTAGPWLAFAVFVVVLIPLVRWLVVTEFQILDYAEARATGPRTGSVAAFFLKQVAASGVFYLLALAAFGLGLLRALAPARLRAAWHQDRDTVAFITWFHCAPLALSMLLAVATGSGLKGAWATAMLSLSGLLLLAWAPALVDRRSLQRIAAGAAALLVVVPAGYIASARMLEPVGQPPARTDWPQAEIAARFEKLWQERTGAPLRIVAGDLWVAGIVAVSGSARPQVLADGVLARSPWIAAADVERDGALFVWWGAAERVPHFMRPLAGDSVHGSERFIVPANGGETSLWLGYIVLPPGSKVPAAALPPR